MWSEEIPRDVKAGMGTARASHGKGLKNGTLFSKEMHGKVRRKLPALAGEEPARNGYHP